MNLRGPTEHPSAGPGPFASEPAIVAPGEKESFTQAFGRLPASRIDRANWASVALDGPGKEVYQRGFRDKSGENSQNDEGSSCDIPLPDPFDAVISYNQTSPDRARGPPGRTFPVPGDNHQLVLRVEHSA